MGCNRSPTAQENRQIQEAASRVAALCGADTRRAEMYVRVYGEIGAMRKLRKEASQRYQPTATTTAPSTISSPSGILFPTDGGASGWYEFERPNWVDKTSWQPPRSADPQATAAINATIAPASEPASAFASSRVPPDPAAPRPTADQPAGEAASESGGVDPTAIVQRTAPADPDYFQGQRFVDPSAWNREAGLVIYRDQTNNRVLSVEGWIQPEANPKGTSSLSKSTKEQIKGPFTGDATVHLAHCWAKVFGGPLLGNLEPFEGTANIHMSPLETELRKIVDAGTPLFVQGVFHWVGPADAMPGRHELAVFMLGPDGQPRQVGCFAVNADGTIEELP